MGPVLKPLIQLTSFISSNILPTTRSVTWVGVMSTSWKNLTILPTEAEGSCFEYFGLVGMSDQTKSPQVTEVSLRSSLHTPLHNNNANMLRTWLTETFPIVMFISTRFTLNCTQKRRPFLLHGLVGKTCFISL